MNLKEPKRKGYSSKVNPNPPLPVLKNSDGVVQKFHGRFNGFAVVIDDKEEQEKVYKMGYFGKGNLSRSFPNTSPEQTQMIRRRQFDNRFKIQFPLDTEQFPAAEKCLVLENSDTEEDYFKNIKASYELSHCNLREYLQLSLVEAYFLAGWVNCLDISYADAKVLTKSECWYLFCQVDDSFIQNYVAYHYFRSKNWVVKSGLKFGVDYLLYKEGPPFYHASYLVKIRVDQIERKSSEMEDKYVVSTKEMCGFSEQTAYCQGLSRIASTTGKDLIILQIIWPMDLPVKQAKKEDFTHIFSVKPNIFRRWKPTQK